MVNVFAVPSSVSTRPSFEHVADSGHSLLHLLPRMFRDRHHSLYTAGIAEDLDRPRQRSSHVQKTATASMGRRHFRADPMSGDRWCHDWSFLWPGNGYLFED